MEEPLNRAMAVRGAAAAEARGGAAAAAAASPGRGRKRPSPKKALRAENGGLTFRAVRAHRAAPASKADPLVHPKPGKPPPPPNS